MSKCECPILGTDTQGYADHSDKFELDLNISMLTLTFVINIDKQIKIECPPKMITLPY